MRLMQNRLFIGLIYGVVFLGAALIGGLVLWVVLAALFGLAVGEMGRLLAAEPPFMGLGAVGWLVLVFLSVAILRGYFGADVALGFLASAFLFDTASYYGGRALAGPPLVPAISPNKTWSGFIAGSACVVLASHWLIPGQAGTVTLVFALILSVLFLAGDLLVSVFKRRAGLKDAGRLLGAHGGVLDRVDSLLLATPLYWLMLVSVG